MHSSAAVRNGRRVAAAAVVALAMLTLAPRTSEVSETGWNVLRIVDTASQAKGGISTLTFQATPPNPAPAVTRFPVYVDASSWQLVSAPAGCTQQTGAVVCILQSGSIRRKHVITISVRAPQPVTFSFVAPATP